MAYESYAGGNFGAGFAKGFAEIFTQGMMQQRREEMAEKASKDQAEYNIAEFLIKGIADAAASGDPAQLEYFNYPQMLDPLKKIDKELPNVIGTAIQKQLDATRLEAEAKRHVADTSALNVLGGAIPGIGPKVPYRAASLTPEGAEQSVQGLYKPEGLPALMAGQREIQGKLAKANEEAALAQQRIRQSQASEALSYARIGELGKSTEATLANNFVNRGYSLREAKEAIGFIKHNKRVSPELMNKIASDGELGKELPYLNAAENLAKDREQVSVSPSGETRKGLRAAMELVLDDKDATIEQVAASVDGFNRNVVNEAVMRHKGKMPREAAMDFIRQNVQGVVDRSTSTKTVRETVPFNRWKKHIAKGGEEYVVDPTKYLKLFDELVNGGAPATGATGTGVSEVPGIKVPGGFTFRPIPAK